MLALGGQRDEDGLVKGAGQVVALGVAGPQAGVPVRQGVQGAGVEGRDKGVQDVQIHPSAWEKCLS